MSRYAPHRFEHVFVFYTPPLYLVSDHALALRRSPIFVAVLGATRRLRGRLSGAGTAALIAADIAAKQRGNQQ